LKILDDGLILRSQATLFASRAARWRQAEIDVFDSLSAALDLASLEDVLINS
jgi:hypothetical protein